MRECSHALYGFVQFPAKVFFASGPGYRLRRLGKAAHPNVKGDVEPQTDFNRAVHTWPSECPTFLGRFDIKAAVTAQADWLESLVGARLEG